MILLEFVPGSGSKCCRFSAFIPIKMEIYDFGLYNCVLDRPVRIVPLREDSVLCQFSTCSYPAIFMVRHTTGSLKALCREHLIGLAVEESELPKPDGQ